jgi:hypothetical protein
MRATTLIYLLPDVRREELEASDTGVYHNITAFQGIFVVMNGKLTVLVAGWLHAEH